MKPGVAPAGRSASGIGVSTGMASRRAAGIATSPRRRCHQRAVAMPSRFRGSAVSAVYMDQLCIGAMLGPLSYWEDQGLATPIGVGTPRRFTFREQICARRRHHDHRAFDSIGATVGGLGPYEIRAHSTINDFSADSPR
jgi:hypothetical protein